MASPRRPPPRASAPPWRWGLALIALGVLVYARAFSAGWMWDDDANVTACAPVLAANGLSTIWLDPHAIQQYYPLVHTTFWIEHRLWGLAPFGYHAVNIALHALSALLLWRLLIDLGLDTRASWIASALFVVHPVHVESVAWITERKNTLSLALELTSALAWVRWAGLAEGRAADECRARWLAVAIVTFALALLSKSVTMTLPLALGIVAWWKRGRLGRREIALVPFLVAAIAFGLLTIHLEYENVGVARLALPLTMAQRILLAGRAAWFYAVKLAFPWRLGFVYPRSSLDPSRPVAWLFPLGALAVPTGLLLLRSRIGRGPAAAALGWAATLAPMLGFFDIFFFRYSWVSDHFQYHASTMPLALAGVGLARAGDRFDRLWKHAHVALPAIVIAALAARSIQRVPIFHDSVALWTDTVRENPDAWIAWNNLGRLALDAGRVDEAEPMLRRAIAIDPRQHEAWNNLGICLMDRRRGAEAVFAFQRALELHPSGIAERENLGRARFLIGDWRGAAGLLRPVVADPRHDPDADVDLVEALVRSGNWTEAEAYGRAARTRFPEDTRFHLLLGVVLRKKGALDEARAVLEDAAARSGRRDPVVLDALAMTLASSARFDEAARVEEEALRLNAGPGAEAVLRPHLESFRRGETPR